MQQLFLPTSSLPLTRRGLFTLVGSALYAAALTQLLGRDLYGDDAERKRPTSGLKPRPPIIRRKRKASFICS